VCACVFVCVCVCVCVCACVIMLGCYWSIMHAMLLRRHDAFSAAGKPWCFWNPLKPIETHWCALMVVRRALMMMYWGIYNQITSLVYWWRTANQITSSVCWWYTEEMILNGALPGLEGASYPVTNTSSNISTKAPPYWWHKHKGTPQVGTQARTHPPTL